MNPDEIRAFEKAVEQLREIYGDEAVDKFLLYLEAKWWVEKMFGLI